MSDLIHPNVKWIDHKPANVRIGSFGVKHLSLQGSNAITLCGSTTPMQFGPCGYVGRLKEQLTCKECQQVCDQQKTELASIKLQWQSIASESLTVEIVGGSPFAYGSKEACQRLLARIGYGTAEYTAVFNKWYYTTHMVKFEIS